MQLKRRIFCSLQHPDRLDQRRRQLQDKIVEHVADLGLQPEIFLYAGTAAGLAWSLQNAIDVIRLSATVSDLVRSDRRAVWSLFGIQQQGKKRRAGCPPVPEGAPWPEGPKLADRFLGRGNHSRRDRDGGATMQRWGLPVHQRRRS